MKLIPILLLVGMLAVSGFANPYLPELVKKAEAGNADAQCTLGFLYSQGAGVARDEKEAVKWFTKAAEQGNADAQCRLGFDYRAGHGVAKDEKEAMKWFKKWGEHFSNDNIKESADHTFQKASAVDSGAQSIPRSEVYVMRNDGTLEGKTLKQHLEKLHEAAEQGNFEAQLMLGAYWLFGDDGFVKNEKKAYGIFSKLAKTNQGNTGPAEYYLGICYFFGAGVDQDEDEAFKWLSLAAKAGGDEADCGLGVCYFLGSGVEEDQKEAFKYFARSAEKGNENGLSCLGYCYLKGFGVKKDEAKAIECFKQSILHNPDIDGLKTLSIYPHYDRRIKYRFVVECLSGSEVKEESSEFVKWLEASNENMSPLVQLLIGDCYSSGNGAIKDESKALEWWIRAGEQGNAEAQCNIGEYYIWRAIKKSDDGKTFYGSKNPSDKKESIKWFRMAAEQGNVTAQNRLYQELLHGEMASDKEEAIKWLKSAASQGDSEASYKLGQYYLNEGKNEKDGVKLIIKSANDGYIRAQFFLAKGYASGDILPKDPGMALIWCQKASEQGDSEAKKMLPEVKAEADADRILKKIESKN